MRAFFFLFLFLSILGCCSLPSAVECERILSLATPRQAFSFFKCAILYDSPAKAYESLSKNTKKYISPWKFRYGFFFLEYDKNKKIPLWKLLTHLQIQEVVQEDENHAILVCLVDDSFANQWGRQYSEAIYLVKEGREWKLDLERTLRERGLFEDLDKAEQKGEGVANGCQFSPTGGGNSLSLLLLFCFLLQRVRAQRTKRAAHST